MSDEDNCYITKAVSSNEAIGDELFRALTPEQQRRASGSSTPDSYQQIPQNTMAYFITTSMGYKHGGSDIYKSSIWRAIAVAGPSVLCCLFIQFVFLIELNEYVNKDLLGENYVGALEKSGSMITLQICSVTLFLVDICSNIRDLCIQSMIIFSKSYRYKKIKHAINIPTMNRLVIFSITTVSEIAVFCFCCIVSVKYLLSAHDIESIILNTLAISFIMQIDDLFFTSLVPEAIRHTICKISVYLPYYPNSYHTRGMNGWQKAHHIYTMFLHLPVCICASVCAVLLYGQKNSQALNHTRLGNRTTGDIPVQGIESFLFFSCTFAITTIALIVHKFHKAPCKRSKNEWHKNCVHKKNTIFPDKQLASVSDNPEHITHASVV